MIILLSIRWKLVRVVVEDVHKGKVTVRIDIGYLGVPFPSREAEAMGWRHAVGRAVGRDAKVVACSPA